MILLASAAASIIKYDWVTDVGDKRKNPSVKESPIADVFEGRHPSDSEKAWAENILAPTLEKSPEKPIGAPSGVNLDEHGHASFTTISGVPIRRLYTQADLPEDWNYDHYLGYPGQPPFTRGIHASGYRGKLFTMRQFSGFASPEETNQRYKYLLEHGGGGLSVAFDLPTLMGYDSDHPASEGEVGKCGVAIDSLEDMEILFSGIDLEKTTVSMTINSPASVLWAMYLVVAEKQGADWKKISGTIQNDILKEYIAQKEYIYPPAPSMRLVVDTFEFGSRFTPRFNTISISGYHIREAGSTALQELAFTLYDGVEYVEWARRRGLDVDEFGPRLSFFFNAHNDFFEEIAKYRGAAADEQHCACGPASFGGSFGGNAVSAHRLLRRGLRASHRRSGAHRVTHATNYCVRIRRHTDRRSAGRLVLLRKLNASNGERCLGLFRQARRHGRDG